MHSATSHGVSVCKGIRPSHVITARPFHNVSTKANSDEASIRDVIVTDDKLKLRNAFQALRQSNKTEDSPEQDAVVLPSTSFGPRKRVNMSGLCTCCRGKGSVVCAPCNGTGVLSRGGYNKKNPIPREVINSKWTAMHETIGWRHFRVIQQRKNGNLTFMLMQASCDAKAQIWVNKELLRDRGRWAAGWLLMSEMPNRRPSSQSPDDEDEEYQITDEDEQQQDQSLTQATTETATSDTNSDQASESGNVSDFEQSHSSQAVTAQQQSKPGSSVNQVSGKQKKGKPGNDGLPAGSKPCRACGGTGTIICKQCDASGVMPIDL